ncbi:MAG: DUF4330 domain-containing protein [Oscillospiraceae bacterium]|nr:DUF4330 domain-containing protein [Oscillospiraceae bacterium]
MAQKPEKFRLKLNLFDSIILLLALAVGAFLLWNALKPAPAAESGDEPVNASTIRYTICLQRCIPETKDAIAEGARLTDSIRNYEMGRVVSVQAGPARELVTDNLNRRLVMAETPGYEDLMVTVEAPGSVSKEAVTLSGGYGLRVGATAYVQGDGFLGSGYIHAIERED